MLGGLDRGLEIALGAFDFESALLERAQIVAARAHHNFLTRLLQARAVKRADRSSSHHKNFHGMPPIWSLIFSSAMRD